MWTDRRYEAYEYLCDVSPARLVDELLQTSFDLIVGEEGHVPRMSNS